MNYYPDPELGPEDFCNHDIQWTPTGVQVGDDEAPGQEYEGKCRLCGYTTRDILWIEWGDNVQLACANGQTVTVRTVKRRADLAQCCLCGTLLYTPIILFGATAKRSKTHDPKPKFDYQIDLCMKCAHSVLGFPEVIK